MYDSKKYEIYFSLYISNFIWTQRTLMSRILKEREKRRKRDDYNYQNRALIQVSKELDMRRIIHRLRLSVFSAMCSLPSPSQLILLHKMSGLYIDSDQSSGDSSDHNLDEQNW